MEDGDTLLVAGGQYGTGNRYRDNLIGRNLRAFGIYEICMSFSNERSFTHIRVQQTKRSHNGQVLCIMKYRPGFTRSWPD